MSTKLLPYDLQFFADDPQEQATEPDLKQDDKSAESARAEPDAKKVDVNKPDVKKLDEKEPSGEKEPSVQDLLVRIAKLERDKTRADGEAAEWKRKFRATQSEKEVIDAEKAEAQAAKEAEFEDMKRTIKIHDLTESYMDLGYPKDLAKKAAIAEVDNDTETRFLIQKQVQEAAIAEKEAEWIKSRPQLQAGQGDQEAEDPFIKGFNSVKKIL